MSKLDLFRCLVGVACIIIIGLGIRARTHQALQQAADQEACFPYATVRIEDVCHCAVDDGWIQCEQSSAIRHIASEG